MEVAERISRTIALTGAVLVAGLLVYKTFFVVYPGVATIHQRFGRVVQTATEPGLYWKVPLVDWAIPINLRTQRAQVSTGVLSKDMQKLNIVADVAYHITDPTTLYTKIGDSYQQNVIEPFASESFKVVIARFNAIDLTSKRPEIHALIKQDLASRLAEKYLALEDINFEFQFSQEFMNTMEKQELAERQIKTSASITKQKQEEATQAKILADTQAYDAKSKTDSLAYEKRTLADAEAYAFKIKADKLSKELIQMRAVEKWNGALPHITGSGQMLSFMPQVDTK
jgi:regulator of protease activity HflC (stomatin/prohibitin superfamily)